MYLSVVFVVLFRISSGLIQRSELNHLLHDLEDRNTEFYHVNNTKDSKPNKSDETEQNKPIFISFLKTDVRSEKLKTSPSYSSSVLEDFSKAITGKELYDNVLEDTLETVAGEVNGILNNRIWEDSLDIIDEKVFKSLSGEPLVRKTRAAIQGKISEIPVKAGNSVVNEGNNCSCKSVVTSFPTVLAVSTFVNTFIETVQSSELLTTTFNITDATPQQFKQFKYRFITDSFRRFGYADANVIAAFAVRPIAEYFDVLLPQAMIQIYGNYMADFLFAEGYLTADNAEKLSMMYCRRLEEYAKIHKVNSKCGYTPKFHAITEGVARFFQYFGDLSYYESWDLCFYYAHELLLAALDYGTLTDLTI